MPSESTVRDREKNRRSHAFTQAAGALTLLLLFIQALSGVLLALHYQATEEGAYVSVVAIVGEAPFGWFIRAVHISSASLLIVSAACWFWSKYFRRSYRSEPFPAWSSAVLLMALLAAFAFSGLLLPWNEVGYHATEIGAGMAASVPIVGEWLRSFLLAGSGSPSGATVARLFSLHAVALPFLGVMLGLYRFFVVERSAPTNRAGGGEAPADSLLLTTSMACVAAGMLLLTLTLFFPPAVGQAADTGAAAPPGIRPPWYFLPAFVAIRLLPGAILGIPTDTLLTTGMISALILILALPRIDRGGGTIVRATGVVAVIYVIGSILMAWLTI